MSDSPKYSTVILGATAIANLAADRRRKAAERRARSAAEAERRRRERIERRGKSLRSDLSEMSELLVGFSRTEAGKRAAADLRAMQNTLSQLGNRPLGEEAEITSVVKQLKELRKHLASTVARAKAEQLASEIEGERAVILQLKRQSAADRLQSLKFDPIGLRELEGLWNTVDSQLQQNNLANARATIVRLRESILRHSSNVEREHARWNSLQEQAGITLAVMQEKLASLQDDERTRQWRAVECEALVQRAEQAERDVAMGKFDQARQECELIVAEANNILAAVDEMQRSQDERDYVTKSLVGSLQEFGFWVEAFPLERPSADTMICATRVDGRSLTVSVPLKGSLRWTPDGFPLEVEQIGDFDQPPIRACDEAAELIDAIKEHVSTTHGVETGELTWNGKDPHRHGTAAKRRIRSNPGNSQRTNEV